MSSGCIRLTNEDITDLYSRVKVGTRVVVLSGKERPGATTRVASPKGAAAAARSGAAEWDVEAKKRKLPIKTVGAVVGLVDNLVKPLLIKRGLEIHGAIVFFSLIGGLAMFGAIGLLLGPLFVSLFLAVVRMYHRDYTPADPHVPAVPGLPETTDTTST